MNSNEIDTLIRNLTFISKLVGVAVKEGDRDAAVRYINSAGNLLNKITEEVLK